VVKNHGVGTCRSLGSDGPNGGSNVVGGGRIQDMSEEGHIKHEDQFQERRTGQQALFGEFGRSVRCNGWRSEGDTKSMKVASDIHLNVTEGQHEGNTLKAHSATSKGHEGARQRPTEPLPSAVSERNAGSSDQAQIFSSLEGQVERHESWALLTKCNGNRYLNLCREVSTGCTDVNQSLSGE